jgi:regulator of protease activity HflC (stomatin/prohibitin superfamily)
VRARFLSAPQAPLGVLAHKDKDMIFTVFGLVIASVIGFVVLCAVVSGWYITEQQTRRVVQRLGKFHKVSSPGWNVKAPFIDSVSAPISMRTEQLPVQELTYTRRGTPVTISGSIQYRINDQDGYEPVRRAFYMLADPSLQIKAHVASSIRGKVPTMELEEVQQNQNLIAQHVKAELVETMEKYGYTIEDVLITGAEPDKEVVAANTRKYAAEMAKTTAENEAEANFTRIKRAAEAEAEAMRQRGIGIANERTQIVEGLQRSVEAFRNAVPGTSAHDVMRMVLFQNYLDTVSKLGQEGNAKVIFMPSNPSAVSSLMDQLGETMISSAEAGKDVTRPAPGTEGQQ